MYYFIRRRVHANNKKDRAQAHAKRTVVSLGFNLVLMKCVIFQLPYLGVCFSTGQTLKVN